MIRRRKAKGSNYLDSQLLLYQSHLRYLVGLSVCGINQFFMKEKKKHHFRFPLWAKALTVLILSVFIVGGTAITFFSNSISSITRKNYVENSIELADTLAVYLSLDDIKVVKNKVEEIYKSIPEEQKVENSYWGEPEWEEYLAKYDEVVEMPEYKALFNQLALFHEKNHARFTTVGYADMENARFVYLVDDAEIEERCLPGSFDDFTDNDMAIYDNPREGFPPEITNMPEYGYLASVARPIFDESNEIVGFTMVDLSMDEIIAKEKANISTLSIIIVSLSICSFGMYFVHWVIVNYIFTQKFFIQFTMGKAYLWIPIFGIGLVIISWIIVLIMSKIPLLTWLSGV